MHQHTAGSQSSRAHAGEAWRSADGATRRCQHPDHALTRRRLLVAAGGLAVALAGCADEGEPPPAAVTLTDEDQCEVCGMVIPAHPGPSAEIFYPEHQPSGHDNPARFCSTWEAFDYHFDRVNRGWEAAAFYVTDYSSVDYSLSSEGGNTLISTHPEAEAFVDADAVTFVVGSEVNGAMGRDLIGFSNRDDAESFQAGHGGSLAQREDVTPEMIAQLGM
jgi:copper chaperone NosL